ncbi:AAA family ATPase [Marinobacter halotolerans]|uniref:AAA family ATPase n=1 Tax=Marinobacter halotolerans TaxID=1569211 RepID=UPI001248800B|nr:AAA family ATPase [Marinobacter halotolerans]
MTTQPELWLLIGGNGAGKTTFYQRFLARRKIPLVNADNIARSLWPDAPEKHSYEAALIAERERFRLIEERQSFCFETVFSHPSKVDFVGTAKAAGFRIRIFYFHLELASLNKARVASRVKSGGHSVPEAKIESRIPRTLANLRQCVGLADELHLVDNSSLDRPYVRLALWQSGQWHLYHETLPQWARELIDPD